MSERESPTTDELQGRIIVLEAMVMAALGLAAKRPTNLSAELIIEMLNNVSRDRRPSLKKVSPRTASPRPSATSTKCWRNFGRA
jgi:hypothetical protein